MTNREGFALGLALGNQRGGERGMAAGLIVGRKQGVGEGILMAREAIKPAISEGTRFGSPACAKLLESMKRWDDETEA